MIRFVLDFDNLQDFFLNEIPKMMFLEEDPSEPDIVIAIHNSRNNMNHPAIHALRGYRVVFVILS